MSFSQPNTVVRFFDGAYGPLSNPGESNVASVGGLLYISYNGGAYVKVGAEGGIATSAPVSGDGSAGTPVTVAAKAITAASIADATLTAAKMVDATITNAKLATAGANTVKANATGGVASPTDVTMASLMVAMGFPGLARGADLGDVNSTFVPATDLCSLYVLPANTITANRTYKIDTSGTELTGSLVYLCIETQTHQVTIINHAGSTIYTNLNTASSVISKTLIQQCFFTSADWHTNTCQYGSA